MSEHVSQGEIAILYRGLLAREPEEGAVAEYLRSGMSKQAMIESIVASEEFKARYDRIPPRGSAGRPASYTGRAYNAIDLTADPEQMARLEAVVRAVWSKLGAEEPHWSVATLPEFRAERMNPEAEAAFYATGRREVGDFFEACARNGIEPPRHGLVLDLGCGLGRLGEHLSLEFAQYHGTDISSTHLDGARRRFAALGRTNTRLSLLPAFLDGAETFDCLFSLIVLQHNPPPIIAKVLDAMLGRLNPGGLGFFQVPSFLDGYRFDTATYLADTAGGSGMEMHALPQRHVFALCHANGCVPIDVVADGRIGPIGTSNTYLVQKRA